jgi:hypothetical protein
LDFIHLGALKDLSFVKKTLPRFSEQSDYLYSHMQVIERIVRDYMPMDRTKI